MRSRCFSFRSVSTMDVLVHKNIIRKMPCFYCVDRLPNNADSVIPSCWPGQSEGKTRNGYCNRRLSLSRRAESFLQGKKSIPLLCTSTHNAHFLHIEFLYGSFHCMLALTDQAHCVNHTFVQTRSKRALSSSRPTQ